MGGKPEEWNQDRKFWHKEGQAKTENVWKSQAGNVKTARNPSENVRTPAAFPAKGCFRVHQEEKARFHE